MSLVGGCTDSMCVQLVDGRAEDEGGGSGVGGGLLREFPLLSMAALWSAQIMGQA